MLRREHLVRGSLCEACGPLAAGGPGRRAPRPGRFRASRGERSSPARGESSCRISRNCSRCLGSRPGDAARPAARSRPPVRAPAPGRRAAALLPKGPRRRARASAPTSQARIAAIARSPVLNRVRRKARRVRRATLEDEVEDTDREDQVQALRDIGDPARGVPPRHQRERTSLEQDLSPLAGTIRAMTLRSVDLPEPFSPRTDQ